MRKKLSLLILSILLIVPLFSAMTNQAMATLETCTVTPDFSNTDGQISFSVTNGLPGADGNKRGVVLVPINEEGSATGKDLYNICKTNEELKSGVELDPFDSDRWEPGFYALSVTERCFSLIFSETADGDAVCKSPAYIEIGNGGNVKQGTLEYYQYGNTGVACTYTKGSNARNSSFTCNTALGKISTNPASFIQNVLTILLSLSGGILVILIIFNGYKLMTSQGDPEKIKDAREGIIAAITGILLIIFSVSVLSFITINILGLPGFIR